MNEARRWYVLQTKPLNEDRVCQQFKHVSLQAVPSLSRGGVAIPHVEVETFCPKIKCISAKRGEDVVKYKPLFPSYLFLRWNMDDAANYHMVKYTRGVNKILGDGERAIPISNEVIELIKNRANESGIIEQKMFRVGDNIKVRRGYLRDLLGILERPVSDSGRVAVLLNLFNRQMRVHLSCADIARA